MLPCVLSKARAGCMFNIPPLTRVDAMIKCYLLVFIASAPAHMASLHFISLETKGLPP